MTILTPPPVWKLPIKLSKDFIVGECAQLWQSSAGAKCVGHLLHAGVGACSRRSGCYVLVCLARTLDHTYAKTPRASSLSIDLNRALSLTITVASSVSLFLSLIHSHTHIHQREREREKRKKRSMIQAARLLLIATTDKHKLWYYCFLNLTFRLTI